MTSEGGGFFPKLLKLSLTSIEQFYFVLKMQPINFWLVEHTFKGNLIAFNSQFRTDRKWMGRLKGHPCIYSGDEARLNGVADQSDRSSWSWRWKWPEINTTTGKKISQTLKGWVSTSRKEGQTIGFALLHKKRKKGALSLRNQLPTDNNEKSRRSFSGTRSCQTPTHIFTNFCISPQHLMCVWLNYTCQVALTRPM